MVKFVARGVEIDGKLEKVQMVVGGMYRGRMMLIVDNESDLDEILGYLWGFPGEYDFVFYAHNRWTSGEWGIDGPGAEHKFPSPQPYERWICNLRLLEDKHTWIAEPVEFVS